MPGRPPPPGSGGGSQRARGIPLKRRPSDLDGHFLRGRLHLARGESTEAIQDFQKVLKLEPGVAPAQIPEQLAPALLRESAARLPDNAELQCHLWMAAARTGDKDLAPKTLAFAASSPATFTGNDEARKTLAELN